MEGDLFHPGSTPPPPALLVGRAGDLSQLRHLLTRQLRVPDAGSVRLAGELLKVERARRTMTQEALSTRAGLGLRVIKKAEASEPVSRRTAELIARSLGRDLEEFIAPSDDTAVVQNLTAVHGWPGVGKTTVARTLAHDQEVRQAFPDGVLWASPGQSPDLLAELAAWGRALGIHDVGRETGANDKERLRYARFQVAAVLREKRMLLIIDDVWEAEHAFALSVGGMKCSTLVTTRLTEVADSIAPSDEDVYRLDVLSEEAAEELLARLAPQVVSRHPKEARELARELERLPLALQVAGPLLRIEERNGLGVTELLAELRRAARLLTEKPPIDVYSETTPTIAAIFRKSTDVLDEQTRKCFAYLAPYAPKPATFDLAALENQWKSINVNAKEMVEVLTERGLLEPIGRGYFWIHAMLVAHAESLLIRRTRGEQRAMR